MTITLINSYSDFLLLKDEWNNLIENIDSPEVFYLFEWTDSYINYYEPTIKENVRIITIREQEKLLAIFPFIVINNTLTFITRNASDYNNCYILKEQNKFSIIKKAIEYILEKENVKKICLMNMPSSEDLYFILEALRENGFSAFLQESVMTPYFEKNNLNPDKSQKKHIKDIERREKRLEENQPIQYHHKKLPTEEEWNFMISKKLERYQFASVKRKNVQAFYKSLLNALGDKVLFSSMYINGEISATHFGFKAFGKLYYYMPSFLHSDKSSGAGLMLLNNIINSCDYNIFDSLIGNEQYKFFWCNKTGMNYHLIAYKRGKETLLQGILVHLKNTKFVRRIFGR